MKKLLVITVAILLGVSSLYASQVKTISIVHKPNTTIVTIHVVGQVRVTHQTEIPKEGRGHRVIIDLLAATHDLGANKFTQLPKCMIQSIRSSQFAVSPEQITRIVFDVDRSPLYRIETDQSSVTIYFTDKGVKQFASWNSKTALPKVKAKKPVKVVSTKSKAKLKTVAVTAAKPATKLATVKVASSKTKAQAKTVAVASTKAKSSKASTKTVATLPKTTKKPKSSYQPKTVVQENDNDADLFTMSRRVATNPALNGNPWISRQTEFPAKTDQPVAGKQQQPEKQKTVTSSAKSKNSSKPPAVLAKASQPKPKVKSKTASQRRPVVVVANTKTKAPETTLVVESPSRMPLKSKMKPADQTKSGTVKTEGQTALANKISGSKSKKSKKSTTVAQAESKPKRKATSRFRRNAGQSHIKGTMVVEFPKRLVIKYKGGKYKDPFETLINANRITNSPIEKRVPNIDGLRLVGVIESDAKKDRALFEDTDGFGYILKSGDKVRNGYVLRVSADKVYFQIFEYGWSRTVALQLED